MFMSKIPVDFNMHMKDSTCNLIFLIHSKINVWPIIIVISLPSYIDPQTLLLPLEDTASPANKAALKIRLVNCKVNAIQSCWPSTDQSLIIIISSVFSS